eukprot:CAMPEP_0184985612 /NCGR_PEP_ID=MMETSP1098-20130426/14205_1 /TAXON_ID=89044 /ORGANISM="Spumella elongata, Strain CCAP 955/1" /LENGTH=304 /DNA_ID=CAMNT_0027509705 /DNA_START=155 /DNA_END=1066 /DNA_ORIENTATION=+
MSNIDMHRKYPILWYDEVSSTMDKARELCIHRKVSFFAVATDSQTNGRGTRGRDWISPKGNLMLTISLKRSLVPIPITLLPLRVGTIIASCMARRITTDTQVKLKWPNDILIDSKKACGVLIEMEGDMLLIGVGCNVLFAPNVNKTTNNAHASAIIRSATCLADHNPVYAEVAAQRMKLLEEENIQKQLEPGATLEATEMNSASSPTTCEAPPPFTIGAGDFHKELAVELCDNLYTWLHAGTDTAGLVHQDFTANMDYSPQRLRDEPNEVLGTVIPTGLNPDGTLNVKFAHNGEPSILCAEYLW